MSFWFSSEREKQVYQMKKRHMHNILDYNKHLMDEKIQRQKFEEREKLENNKKSNQEALEELLIENRNRQYKRYNQRDSLKNIYERQMKQKQDKEQQEKRMEAVYQKRFQEHLDFEEGRRARQLQKMFNRITYLGVPAQSQRRLRTEPDLKTTEQNPEKPYDPEQYQYQKKRKSGSLLHIDPILGPMNISNSNQQFKNRLPSRQQLPSRQSYSLERARFEKQRQFFKEDNAISSKQALRSEYE